MKRKQITAILISAIMAVSSCMPANGISAIAAETDGERSAQEEAIESQEDESPDETENVNTIMPSLDVQDEPLIEKDEEKSEEPGTKTEEAETEEAETPEWEENGAAVSEDEEVIEEESVAETEDESEQETEGAYDREEDTEIIEEAMAESSVSGKAAIENVSGTCGDNMTWSLEGGVLTISGTGEMTESPWLEDYGSEITTVVVEDGVTNITGFAFAGCSNLTEVALPDSLESIGGYAFDNCSSLTEITIPDGVTEIGGCAFYQSGLTSIVLPDSMTSIEPQTFVWCTELVSVTIPDTVTEIGYSAFGRCSSLKNITIPYGVTDIWDGTFSYCSSLRNITIPDSVTSIGENAFGGCRGLRNITIPDSVTNIDESAFYNHSTYLVIHGTPGSYADTFARDLCIDFNITWTLKGGVLTISGTGEMVFYSERSWDERTDEIEKVIIENGVTEIHNNAFFGCQNLTEVTIPESVTRIGTGAFRYCNSLTDITIPGSVAVIDEYAFGECDNLTTVTLLDGVTQIGSGAFLWCRSLKSVTIPESVTSIAGNEAIPAFWSHAEDMVIHGIAGSYAHEYAINYEINYEMVCTNHSWNETYTIDKEPTYTEEGSKSIHCSICDAVKEGSEVVIPKLSGDEWLSDYDYSFSSVGDREVVKLEYYNGSNTNIWVPGTVTIDGVNYNISADSAYVWSSVGLKSISFGSGFIFPENSSVFFYDCAGTLESIDMSEADLTDVFSMEGMFEMLERLEYLDLGNQTIKLEDAQFIFSRCTSLQSLDLSGFDLSDCLVFGMFNQCDALQTLQTPVNVILYSNIELPGLYTDSEGNLYSCLPEELDSSITLTRVTDMSDWLSDYKFRVKGDRIVLTEYTGDPGTVTVPGSAVIGTREFNKIELSGGIWRGTPGAVQLVFEEGVILPEYSSKLFRWNWSIKSIDLSKVDVSEATDMSNMFTGCGNLSKIITPKNITLDANLPAPFEDAGGNIYFQLPKNLSESIVLTRTTVDQSEWLNDFEYYISGDKIILTEYMGYNEDLTVPGSASVNGTNYGKIQISTNMDWSGMELVSLSFSEGVIFPDDCSNLFSGGWSLQSIDLSNIDTSNVTNMSGMFDGCESLRTLDVSGFDTSNVTDMTGMFNWCCSLQSLDVSGFDTSSVTSTTYMFNSCDSLLKLDMGNWDLSAVNYVDGMLGSGNNFSVIKAPKGLSEKIGLPAIYTGSDGRIYKSLPMNKEESIILTWTSEAGDPAYGDSEDSEQCPIVITEQPEDVAAVSGGTAVFTVAADGTDMAYQWQWSTDGMIWKDCSSGTYNTDTFSFTMKGSYDGRQYRCKITEGSHIAYTRSALLILANASIISQPSDVEAAIGETVTFTVGVQGNAPVYQWQWSADGTTWKNCTSGGYNTESFSFVMKATLLGRQYRCKVTCGGKTLISDAATITLSAGPEIISQPSDVEAAVGETVTFTVGVQGEDPIYQWQWSSNGTTWKNCTSGGYNTESFSFTMKETLSGRKYRCKVTCGGETLISDAATITLRSAVEIISQPCDVQAAAGEEVVFTVEAQSNVEEEDPAYQWQWSSNGTTWKNCTSGGYNTDTFSFTMKETLSGRQYRCKVTCGGESLISDAATITLFRAVEIISQPCDVQAAAGEEVVFTVEAQSNVEEEDPAYQWQWSSNGTAWKNCTSGGYNTDTFSFTMKTTLSGRQYRCKVTCGGETLISDAGTITLK